MNVREFSLLVKTEYKAKEGARFFSQRALLSALLEKAGLDAHAPLTAPFATVGDQALRDLQRLLEGYPLQYYLGTEFFCGNEFFVSEGVLIPRPETELLVALAAERAPQDGVVFDFCCGSGCVGLSLLKKREDLSCRMFDLSPEALALSEKNRDKLGLSDRASVRRLDVLSEEAAALLASCRPCLVVANPPYLTCEEMENLEQNVAFEPSMALFGGPDGLLFYKAFLRQAEISGVPLLCEIGWQQKKALIPLLDKGGFVYEFFSDSEGRDRAFYAKKKIDEK